MKKRVWAMGAAVMMMGVLTACSGGAGSKETSAQAEETKAESTEAAAAES